MNKITSTSEKNEEYIDIVLKASLEETIFNNFKQNINYNDILEHVSESQGHEYIRHIDPTFLSDNLDKFKINDIIGNPRTYLYPKYGKFSPTTLRYVKVLENLKNNFVLENSNIIEIGCGYGGQYTILKQIFNPKKYTFVDLPTVLPLIEKYIKILNLNENTVLVNGKDLNFKYDEEYDLIVSNYAISECNTETQNHYINNILKNSKHGYITHNQFNGHSLDEFIKILNNFNKNIKIIDELPLTGNKNVIIIW